MKLLVADSSSVTALTFRRFAGVLSLPAGVCFRPGFGHFCCELASTMLLWFPTDLAGGNPLAPGLSPMSTAELFQPSWRQETRTSWCFEQTRLPSEISKILLVRWSKQNDRGQTEHSLEASSLHTSHLCHGQMNFPADRRFQHTLQCFYYRIYYVITEGG